MPHPPEIQDLGVSKMTSDELAHMKPFGPVTGTAASAFEQVKALRRAGQRERAVQAAQSLLARWPDYPPALEVLVEELSERDPAAALEPARKLAQLHPREHLRHTAVATLCHKMGDRPAAETSARQALALNPFNAQAHNLLGAIHAEAQYLEEAEFHYRQVLLLHEPVAPICANLAGVLSRMGRFEEATFLFEQTQRLDPNNLDGLLSWIRMEETANQIDSAWDLMKRVPESRWDSAPCCISRAVLHRRGKRSELALEELEKVRAKHPSVTSTPVYQYELGNVLDSLRRYDEAFAAYQEANALVRRLAAGKRDYLDAHFTDLEAKLRRVFTRSNVAAMRAGATHSPIPQGLASPIFIVGFPRSGTTLVEQMLSSHPDVAAGDELDYVTRLTRLATHLSGGAGPYPDCLTVLPKAGGRPVLDKFRDYYLFNARMRGIGAGGKRFFTDKMPLNETHLGLIHLVFPEAPIVHLIRHPLDVVLSTFFVDLSHGGNCSYGLETAARHYVRIFGLINHYRQEIDLKYLPVRYEDLVDDAEPNVRRLLDFVGLEWDERCLAFYDNQRYARTASYAQVKEKIYTRSRFRYRKYLEHLAPVLPILQPAIDALGYTVEGPDAG
jgi:tetratricopeptide (TPR) repeat protein